MLEHISGLDSPHLYCTRHGHVRLCPCCNRYEIVFHHTCVQLAPLHFVALVRDVQSFPVDWLEAECFAILHLTPVGASVAAQIRLDHHDILELCDLLNGAAAMGALETMLGDVLNVSDQA